MAKKLFSDDDFDKHLSIGDELCFDKAIKKFKLDLTWAGTDLDICAFMLDKDGVINDRADLVYFNSRNRWKTDKDFSDPAFDATKGKISTWPAPGFNNPLKWMGKTLPASLDGSVIGSWDDMADSNDDDCQETMHVLLEDVNVHKYNTIVFAAVVAKDKIEAGETFADAKNPVVIIRDAEKNEVIAQYKLAASFAGKDAVCFGKMVYNPDTFMWNFVPMAAGYSGGMFHLANEVFS